MEEKGGRFDVDKMTDTLEPEETNSGGLFVPGKDRVIFRPLGRKSVLRLDVLAIAKRESKVDGIFKVPRERGASIAASLDDGEESPISGIEEEDNISNGSTSLQDAVIVMPLVQFQQHRVEGPDIGVLVMILQKMVGVEASIEKNIIKAEKEEVDMGLRTKVGLLENHHMAMTEITTEIMVENEVNMIGHLPDLSGMMVDGSGKKAHVVIAIAVDAIINLLHYLCLSGPLQTHDSCLHSWGDATLLLLLLRRLLGIVSLLPLQQSEPQDLLGLQIPDTVRIIGLDTLQINRTWWRTQKEAGVIYLKTRMLRSLKVCA